MHARRCEPFLDEGYKAGLESGEIQWSAYLVMYKVINRAFQGKTVSTILRDIDNLLPFGIKVKNHMSIDGMLAYQLVYRNLAGDTHDVLEFHNDTVDEAQFLSDCRDHHGAMAIVLFKIAKAHALYLYGEHRAVVELCREAEPLLEFIIAHLQLSEHNLLFSRSGWSLSIRMRPSPSGPRSWPSSKRTSGSSPGARAHNCPENYLHKYLLASAEIARIRGDHLQAMEALRPSDRIRTRARLRPLRGARHGTPRRGSARLRQAALRPDYLVDAHYGYKLWGATRKVAKFEREFPFLGASRSGPASLATTTTTTGGPSATTGRYAAALDLAGRRSRHRRRSPARLCSSPCCRG